MRFSKAGLCAATLAFMPAFALAQTVSAPVFFENVRVFDGARMIAKTNVLIEDGKVRAIGPSVPKPANVETIDGAGKTLLPALIDSHVHAFDPVVLKQSLIFGVGTVLDMFTDPKFVARIRAEEAAGKALDMADIRSAGTLVTAPGGHGTEYGMKIPTISDPSEAQAFVDARIAEGSDYIKLVYDNALEYGAKTPTPTLSLAVMKAVIEAAHKRSKLAVVHIGTEEQARAAVGAGADGLVHLFIGESSSLDFGTFVAAHHVFVIPTFTVLHSICNDPSNGALIDDPKLGPLLNPADVASLKAVFPMSSALSCKGAEAALRQLEAAKVPILTGTDAPNPGTAFGASLHAELAALVDAGLTPLEALTAATATPARIFHLEDRGRIESGKRADLLLVTGDPTVNIKATRDIVAVWKLGVRDDRDAYLAKVRTERNQQKNQAAAAPPAGSENGLVSDFEGPDISTHFGSWAISTDSVAGGKSTANMKIVPGGANSSKGALEISGEILPPFAYPWAGASFNPGAGPMQPANLSSKKEIAFWTKGDGKTYRLLLFAKNTGMIPLTQTFVAGPEWKEITIPLASFKGADSHALLLFAFCGGPAPGAFDFQIDNVRFN